MDGVRGMVEEIIRFKIIEIATRAKRVGGMERWWDTGEKKRSSRNIPWLTGRALIEA